MTPTHPLHVLAFSITGLLSLAGSLWCFRVSIPLILIFDETRQPGKLEAYLPIRGRWLQAGVGAALMLTGILLAMGAAGLALHVLLSLFRPPVQG